MIIIYLENPLGALGKYGLEPLQSLISTLTTASPDFPVVRLPSDCGEIWMSACEEK